MKILVVSQYFWPENFRINDLVKDFLGRGHDVTVLTGYPNYPDGKVFSDFKKNPTLYSDFLGADIIRVPLLPRGSGNIKLILNYISFALSASFLGVLRLRSKQFDVIFVCQLSPVTVGLPAIVLRSLKKTPVVLWILDLWPETLSALGFRSKYILRPVAVLVGFIYNRCDLILGQSRQFFGSVKKHSLYPERFRYFPSWAETLFSEKCDVPALEVEVESNVFYIVFTGNVGEAQDFSAILDAVDILKEDKTIRWLIVGEGRDAVWVKNEIYRRGLGKSIKLLGRFPIERMPSFIAHADALLVTLKKDPVFALTIPGKVQSYLMSGVPLLGMLNGEGSQVIVDAKAGLVCAAGDSKGLAESVIQLKKMTKKCRDKLGENGRSYAKLEFNREKLMDQLENWFHDLGNHKSDELW